MGRGGLTTITHKGKNIFFTSYDCDSKEQVVKLLNDSTKAYCAQPKNSVLALVDVSSLHFDMEVLNQFKNSRTLTDSHEKKVALIGVKGLLKVAYNFVIGMAAMAGDRRMRIFDSEEDAKEWLVSD